MNNSSPHQHERQAQRTAFQPERLSDAETPHAGAMLNEGSTETPLPVTRGLPFSSRSKWEFLAAGVDSLDLGVYVDWRKAPEEFHKRLENGKEKARGTQGIPFGNDGACLILPSGKAGYAFHLQYPEFHLFISNAITPKQNTPNSFLSLNSFPLWKSFLPGALSQPVEEFRRLGGHVHSFKPNRVDICADFYIEDRLTSEFLQQSIVAKSTHRRTEVEADDLETYYVGNRKSPVSLRIYDKGREVLKAGNKLWFRDIWDRPAADVWRFEYQIRRKTLKQFSINSCNSLTTGLPALWKYLTSDWSSLRIRSKNQNISRCPLHPLWLDVQKAGKTFGELINLNRDLSKGDMPVVWYVKHIYGCLKGYAARKRINSLEDALAELRDDIPIHASPEDWDEAIRIASIQLGYLPNL